MALELTRWVPVLLSQARIALGLSSCISALELPRCVPVLVKQARVVLAYSLLPRLP